MGDVNEEVRAAALDALVELESEEAIDALIRALDDESPTIRGRAARALSNF